MDPTQNQSGTPGPIFSAGPGPEEPPMTGAPSNSGPSNPFSGGGDIILQPSDDYYSGKSARSKKPLIIGGIIAIVAIITLLILLPIISKGNSNKTIVSKETSEKLSELESEYELLLSKYRSVGYNPTNDNISIENEDVSFLPVEKDEVLGISESINTVNSKISSLKEENLKSELSNLYEDYSSIEEKISSTTKTMENNVAILNKFLNAFLEPIDKIYSGIIPASEGCETTNNMTQLINDDNQKISSAAENYQSAYCEIVEIVKSGGDLNQRSVKRTTAKKSLAQALSTIDKKETALEDLKSLISKINTESTNEK